MQQRIVRRRYRSTQLLGSIVCALGSLEKPKPIMFCPYTLYSNLQLQFWLFKIV